MKDEQEKENLDFNDEDVMFNAYDEDAYDEDDNACDDDDGGYDDDFGCVCREGTVMTDANGDDVCVEGLSITEGGWDGDEGGEGDEEDGFWSDPDAIDRLMENEDDDDYDEPIIVPDLIDDDF